jgi:hypothetical protein
MFLSRNKIHCPASEVSCWNTQSDGKMPVTPIDELTSHKNEDKKEGGFI